MRQFIVAVEIVTYFGNDQGGGAWTNGTIADLHAADHRSSPSVIKMN
jgi:hypothetical protein